MRHKWNQTGPWQGSKDVRTCDKCGSQAHKVGMYSGWRVRVDGGPWMYFERLPPCPWPEPDKLRRPNPRNPVQITRRALHDAGVELGNEDIRAAYEFCEEDVENG